jgi:CBS domain-containing protein
MENKPVHKWEKAEIQDLEHWNPQNLLVEEFMTTDIFTVRKNDILALAADMMDWQKIRYIPVEDNKGKIAGLITSRIILRHLRKSISSDSFNKTTIGEIMITELHTVKPDTLINEAMELMEKHKIGCLPVVSKGNLVGIVTEEDFFTLSKRIFKRLQ